MNQNQQVEQWFLSYADYVYNFLVYFTGSTDVEDLVQETFIHAMNGIDGCRDKSRVKPWLCAIARNVAIDFSRKGKRRIVEAHLTEDIESNLKSTEEIVEIHETTQSILDFLQNISPRYRDVLVLRGLQELSSAETARILGWTQNKVNVTYHRALKTARNRFNLEMEGAFK